MIWLLLIWGCTSIFNYNLRFPDLVWIFSNFISTMKCHKILIMKTLSNQNRAFFLDFLHWHIFVMTPRMMIVNMKSAPPTPDPIMDKYMWSLSSFSNARMEKSNTFLISCRNTCPNVTCDIMMAVIHLVLHCAILCCYNNTLNDSKYWFRSVLMFSFPSNCLWTCLCCLAMALTMTACKK